MEKKLLIRSMTISTISVAMILFAISAPMALAVTPPYYRGPYQGYQYEDNKYMEVAQLGAYDYSNPPTAPYPCLLHQAYAYTWSPWAFDGFLSMETMAWDSSDTTIYYEICFGWSGMGAYHWPSPEAYSATISIHQKYINTQTQETFSPPDAVTGFYGTQ